LLVKITLKLLCLGKIFYIKNELTYKFGNRFKMVATIIITFRGA
jgi:hypothetical protein